MGEDIQIITDYKKKDNCEYYEDTIVCVWGWRIEKCVHCIALEVYFTSTARGVCLFNM